MNGKPASRRGGRGVLGSTRRGVGRAADSGVDTVTGTLHSATDVVKDAGGATGSVARRAARGTRRAGRSANDETRWRMGAIVRAARGERPPRRWPPALGTLGLGLGLGAAVGALTGRALAKGGSADDEPEAATESGGALPLAASNGMKPDTPSTGAGTRSQSTKRARATDDTPSTSANSTGQQRRR